MKRITNVMLILTVLLINFTMASCEGSSVNDDSGDDSGDELGDFRIVGYLFGTSLTQSTSRIDFSRLTHINIAFINPTETGEFESVDGLNDFVSVAHQNNVKVLASLGGGSSPEYLQQLIDPANRERFIANIKEFLNAHDLDGIDIDLEGEMVTNNYEGFIVDLAQAIKPSRMITAAVATNTSSRFTDLALSYFDFITIMSYDKTGPWNPSKPGQHSSYEHAVDDLHHWRVDRSLPKEKLNLGVPFYGYDFNGSASKSWTFRTIVAQYPGAENLDEIPMAGGGTIYYNGIPTIKQKTTLALNQAGGVSIWHLTADAVGEQSLLEAINEVVQTSD